MGNRKVTYGRYGVKKVFFFFSWLWLCYLIFKIDKIRTYLESGRVGKFEDSGKKNCTRFDKEVLMFL